MKINKSTISLNGLEFRSKIGLYDFEKEKGNNFIINISVEIKKDKINYDDSIEGTVDYSNLFSIIEGEMTKEYNLIETVAHKISTHIHSQIKNIKLCKLEIIKKNPPIEGNVDNSSFTLETTS
jgi:dihydroneopterin aldolase